MESEEREQLTTSLHNLLADLFGMGKRPVVETFEVFAEKQPEHHSIGVVFAEYRKYRSEQKGKRREYDTLANRVAILRFKLTELGRSEELVLKLYVNPGHRLTMLASVSNTELLKQLEIASK